MKKNIVPKHFPALLGLVLLLGSLATGVFLINQVRSLVLKASPLLSPQQVKITNIGSNSFVVSWTTTGKTTGAVSVGETIKTGELRKDIRDQEASTLISSPTHLVVVDNLKPQIKYFFKIISGGKIYDNTGKPYEVTTANQKIPADNDIASGKILTPDNQPAGGVLVYLSLANTIPQAAMTDNNGNWVIPLATARTLDLIDFSHYDRQLQVEEILVKGEEQTASATLTTGNDNPSPDIILGQNYNFLNQPLNPSPSPETGGEESQFIVPTFAPSEEEELTITFPAEGEQVNSSVPEFLGKAPKGQKLEIEVESEELISSQANTDQKGQWNWSPNTPLSPGEHQISVSYTDKNGILKKITRSFVILAAGQSELPSFTATPSGQKVTATPIPTVTTTATPFPSPGAGTTLIPTVLPTTTPIPSATEMPNLTPTEEPEIPPTGISLPTKFFFGLGIATLITGVILVLF